jgi:hypothetical protein
VTDVVTSVLDQAGAANLRPAQVVDTTESGTVVVLLEGQESIELRCDMLVTNDLAPPVLVPGDRVLAWVPAGGAKAIVLGRIGPSRGLTPEPGDPPETLTIEARQRLTLKVGDGSITIGEDGKILIKGKDLVSHAQRMNRIKGGAVAIN